MVNATCLNTSQSLTSKCWIFFNCSFIEKKNSKQNVQSCNDIPNTCKKHVLICMFIHVDLFHVIYIQHFWLMYTALWHFTGYLLPLIDWFSSVLRQYSSHVTYFNEIVLLLGVDADDGQIILPLNMDGGTRVGLRAAFKVNVSVDGELGGGSILMQGGGFEVTR